MPIYAYEALNGAGKSKRGIIDAESPRAARVKLRGQGIYPTQIREEIIRPRGLPGLFAPVRAKEVVQVSRQLATLVEAGIPLASALSALVEQLAHPVLGKVLAQVRESIREGSSFADALALHPQVFSGLFIGLVRAGEVSGNLGPTLARWADFSEHQMGLRQRLRAAMVYPVFMFFIGLGVLFFLLSFVVPTVTRIFADLGQALPLPTVLLIAVSGFLSRFWWVLGGSLAVILLFLRRALKQESGAEAWDRLKLRIPLWGSLHRKGVISRWSRTLSTLLRGGLPLLQAWDTSQGVVGNRLLSQALAQARESIREGQEITLSLKKSPLFPAMVLEMLSAGEKSGDVAGMLDKVAGILENEVEIDLGSLMSLLEPVMILIMGIGVGFVALSILLPILQMSQIVR
ncbi:MAG: type II secretion system F family protein [Deltaproteobacteria bacterium]|nr:type II secretion system F family protein [Deltaproteobacteria bacterium]